MGLNSEPFFLGDLKDSRTGAIPLNNPPLSILVKEFCILELNLEPTLFTQTHISTCFNSLWTFQPLPSTARILCFSFIIEEYSSLRDFYRPLGLFSYEDFWKITLLHGEIFEFP